VINIIPEAIALVSGVLVGFILAETILGIKKEREDVKAIVDEKTTAVSEILKDSSGTMFKEQTDISYTPSDFQDLIGYLSDKYMLLDLTLSTSEGLPVASNSTSPEEDAAIAPEILRMLGEMVDSDKIIISGKNEKILVFRADPEIIVHARVRRDITAIEIEKLKDEITRFMEGYM
jgi:hypothetical protein